MNQTDAAAVSRLHNVLATVGKALDHFVQYDHPDPLQTHIDWQNRLQQPLPINGIGLDAVTRELCDNVIPFGSPIGGPGFTGFVTTGPTTIATGAVAAALIAAPQRQTLHAFNFLENLSLDWLCELFGIPSGFQGIYSSGGSVANLIGMGAARQYAFERIGVDPAASGVTSRMVIYASAETHHTIKRAAGVLGVGRNNVVPIATDHQGRMRPDALEMQIQADRNEDITPMAIVANVGTTNTGAIDPVKRIGEIAKKQGIWYHIDGAYGLPGLLDRRIAPLYEGLDMADSLIVDPHKWMGACVGIAATFVRDRALLYRSFTQEPADYLEGTTSKENTEHSMDSFGVPYFDLGTELSAPSRGVMVWAILKEIGVEGLRQRVIRHNDMAKRVAERADRHPRLELLQEPTLSVCCFRYISNEIEDLNSFNQQIHRQLIRGNRHMPSTTRIAGKLAIRPCFLGARTSSKYADELVDEVLKIGDELSWASHEVPL